ncbi:MAG TPA: SLC13 family permease [Alphaproteobacteria bacterium]|nr:SLC13 family permease [Alphaproteobacteria bacterium]
MTLPQALAFAVTAGMMALFIWDRLRYDLVALLALLAAVAVGVVPVEKAFTGFSDQIVILIASALVVSAGIAKSGVVETAIRPLTRHMKTVGMQIAILGTAVTVLSAFMKNIGALAIFLPVALQVSRKAGTSPSCLLMPLAFGSLLGGVMTLIGTSPNVIVSRIRQEMTGEPFRMFDFMPVGICIAVLGVLFLTVGFRLLPGSRKRTDANELMAIAEYTTEVLLPAGSPIIGKTVYDLETLGEGEVTVAAIIREKRNRYVPSGHWVLFENDILILESDPDSLQTLIDNAGLALVGSKKLDAEHEAAGETGTVEAVIRAESQMVGRALRELRLRERFGVNLLAVSRAGDSSFRLRHIRFQPGDVILLEGDLERLPEVLHELGCLPLAERRVALGQKRRWLLPIALLLLAIGSVGAQLVPVHIAFFAAAVMMVLTRCLTLKEAYDAIEWPILILLGALIPVSDSIQATGGTAVIAGGLSNLVGALPAYGAVGLVMVLAMAVTPFLNNAATVLVMAPIAAALAKQLSLNPDPFLMAVAIGAACDFLTPIGHQCNTLVMGPGGYRFGDYWRLGLPLSIMVVVVATPLLLIFWPLSG